MPDSLSSWNCSATCSGVPTRFGAPQPAMNRSWNCLIWVPKDWDWMPSTSMMMFAPGQSPASMMAFWAALASFSVSRQMTRQ